MTEHRKQLEIHPFNTPFRWCILFGVWLAYYCFGLTIVTLAPLVTEISSDLKISYSQMGTILGAWQLIYIGSAIPLGILLDRIGIRRSLMFAFAMIALSVVLRSTAENYTSLFLAVAIFGLGGPLISVGAPKSIGLWFDGQERGFAMGIYMTAPTLGTVTGLSLTNSFFMPLLEGDWRSVLLIYAAFIFSASLIWLIITAHKAHRIIEKRELNKKRDSEHKNILRLIKIPAFQIVLVMAIGIFFMNHGLNNWLPEILRSKGMNAAKAGNIASIPVFFAVISSLSIPRLAKQKWRIPILFILFSAFGLSTLALQASEGLLLFIALILQGLARGSAMTLAILVLLDIPGVGKQRAGVAGGLFFSAAEIGGVLGPVSIGILSDTSGGFNTPLLMLSGVSILLLLLLAALKKQQKMTI